MYEQCVDRFVPLTHKETIAGILVVVVVTRAGKLISMRIKRGNQAAKKMMMWIELHMRIGCMVYCYI